MSSTPCLFFFWKSKIGKSEICCYFSKTNSCLGQQATLFPNMIGSQSSGSALRLPLKKLHDERGQEVSRNYSNGFCQKNIVNVQVCVEVELVNGTASSPLDGNSLKRNCRTLGFCFSSPPPAPSILFFCVAREIKETLLKTDLFLLFFDE